jgi:orotate phosphoribosyltransferase
MEDTASKIAEFLLQIKAIRLQPHKPFTWSSGWKSPVYCDNRIALSHPRIRTYIRQELVKVVEEHFGRPEVIAGVATAAIAQGALVAEALGLPFVYVRASAKGHGLQNKIEGEVHANQSAVVVEDLISTGRSSLSVVNTLRDAGVVVKGIVSIFNYGFREAAEAFHNAGCPVYSLSNYETLLRIAVETNYIGESDLETLNAWRERPAEWHSGKSRQS